MSSETISVEKMDSEDFKSRVPKINDYIWARYVDVSDDYPHELDEAEALENLESFYALPSEQENQDVVYLGVLLFERGFVDEDNKLEYFKRAYQIFERYRRVTGEHDGQKRFFEEWAGGEPRYRREGAGHGIFLLHYRFGVDRRSAGVVDLDVLDIGRTRGRTEDLGNDDVGVREGREAGNSGQRKNIVHGFSPVEVISWTLISNQYTALAA